MNFWKSVPKLLQNTNNLFYNNLLVPQANYLLSSISSIASRAISLYSLHKKGPPKKVRVGNKVMEGRPFLKGVVLKTLIKKPRKPNSANRKCVLVKLSTGKEAIAYVPGVGHNLQEHQFVLVRGGRLKDVPGVKVRCVRGAYDLPHVGK